MAVRELKVCLLGDSAVGKTCIISRFVEDRFDLHTNVTVGASYRTKTVACGNERYNLQIWDTSGPKADSFLTTKMWVKELKEDGPENIVLAIVGNKNDLGDSREVPMMEAKEFAESVAAIFIETSARNSSNIEELFQKICKQIPPQEEPKVDDNKTFKFPLVNRWRR